MSPLFPRKLGPSGINPLTSHCPLISSETDAVSLTSASQKAVFLFNIYPRNLRTSLLPFLSQNPEEKSRPGPSPFLTSHSSSTGSQASTSPALARPQMPRGMASGARGLVKVPCPPGVCPTGLKGTSHPLTLLGFHPPRAKNTRGHVRSTEQCPYSWKSCCDAGITTCISQVRGPRHREVRGAVTSRKSGRAGT